MVFSRSYLVYLTIIFSPIPMNDGFVFSCLRWIWLPVWRTGLKPKMARILIISGADSRGIFDKVIHFNVQTGQRVVPGRQFDQELVMFLKPFLEIPDRLLFRQSLVGNIREKINGHEIFSFPVDFNKSLHAQVRLSDFVLIIVCETRQARLKIPGRNIDPSQSFSRWPARAKRTTLTGPGYTPATG